MQRIRVAACLAGLVLVACGCSSRPATAPQPGDAPRIVPWHVIGNIGLGMSRVRVEGVYGRGAPATPLRDAPAWVYRGRGTIRVEYDVDGKVAAVETNSSVYVSPRASTWDSRLLRASACS